MKYFIFTLGCQMNKSDSERIAALLESAGFTSSASEAETDLLIVNACSVRQAAVDRILGRKRIWDTMRKRNPNFRVAVTGCVLDADRKKMMSTDSGIDILIDIKDIACLPKMYLESIETGLRGKSRRPVSIAKSKAKEKPLLKSGVPSLNLNKQVSKHMKMPLEQRLKETAGQEYLEIMPRYSSSFTAFVPIMTGCNNFCSYCAVPYTRGPEVSRPFGNIISEVKSLVEKGYKEIYLLGQNVNSYRDFPRDVTSGKKVINFVDLCREIDEIPGDFWVRFTSSNPYDFPDELISFLAKSKHFCKMLHLAMQSGDDEILRKMNRRYTSAMFLSLVEKIRKAIPDITLGTDVIVRFCGETDEAFKKTLEMIRKCRFSQVFVGQYSVRPGTLAAKMFKDDVPKIVKAERNKKINILLAKIAKKENERFVGREMKVLVEAKQKDHKLFGRNEHGIGVVFSGPEGLVGSFATVRIESAEAFGLQGSLK